MHITICLVSLSLCLGFNFTESQGDGPATDRRAKPSIAVRGEGIQPLQLTSDDLSRMMRHSVKAKERDGKESVFDGVLVADILKRAGVKQGKEIRGEFLSMYLLVEAADGYRVIFSLPEMDEAFTDRTVLLVDRKDGKPLSDREGPFRIIVPDEKRPTRWVRQVVSLTIRASAKDPIPTAPSSR